MKIRLHFGYMVLGAVLGIITLLTQVSPVEAFSFSFPNITDIRSIIFKIIPFPTLSPLRPLPTIKPLKPFVPFENPLASPTIVPTTIPTLTLTPTLTPTSTPTLTPTPTETPTPTPTETPTLTPTETPVPTETPTPTETPVPTETPTPFPTETPTPTLTLVPTETPTPTLIPTETPVPTETPIPTAALSPTPEAGLVAYWQMEETSGSTVADLSGNNHQLTITGSSIWTTDVPSISTNPDSRSLFLDGSSYAYLSNAADNPVFNFSGGFTLEAWIKTSGTNDPGIISKWGGGGGYMMWITGGPNGRIENNFANGDQVAGDTIINDGKWHFVAVSWDGLKKHIYVDGIEDHTPLVWDTPPINSGTPLIIGSYDNGSGGKFTGNMDEVKIWNAARTAEEIKADGGIITGSPVVLNEFMANPSVGNEWVELYNKFSSPVNISSWSIADISNHTIHITNDSIGGNGFKVYSFNSSVLNNGGDTINLKDNSGQIVDTVTYTGSMTGVNISTGRDSDGIGTWKKCNNSSPNATNNGAC